MHRFALNELKEWVRRDSRKPMVLRGARQVGKSFLVHMLAEAAFDSLAEVNFEQMPDVAELFQSKQPQRILPLLESRLNTSITPGKTLLFLDEIQAAPEVFASLRYFYEQMAELHVIAAGSLLEFVLEEHAFSMPVGRIEYLHLGPMSFEEFLLALGRDKLLAFVQNYELTETIPQTIHDELMGHVKDYCVVGGMPEAVAVFARQRSYLESERVASSILTTYRDDFGKYGRRVNHHRLEKVFAQTPRLVGLKVKYTQIDREEKSRDLKSALHVLELARVVHRVRHSDANGLPLGAEADERHFKALFLDVGLLCRACGLTMSDVQRYDHLMLVNSGAICEQFVGQHLLYSRKFFETPELFCWLRRRGSSSAEVDYLISEGADIIPVEVKAGKTGSLKSLHTFVHEKGHDFAIRFNAALPSLVEATTSVATLEPRNFQLLSLPFYLINQTRRLCRQR